MTTAQKAMLFIGRCLGVLRYEYVKTANGVYTQYTVKHTLVNGTLTEQRTKIKDLLRPTDDGISYVKINNNRYHRVTTSYKFIINKWVKVIDETQVLDKPDDRGTEWVKKTDKIYQLHKVSYQWLHNSWVKSDTILETKTMPQPKANEWEVVEDVARLYSFIYEWDSNSWIEIRNIEEIKYRPADHNKVTDVPTASSHSKTKVSYTFSKVHGVWEKASQVLQTYTIPADNGSTRWRIDDLGDHFDAVKLQVRYVWEKWQYLKLEDIIKSITQIIKDDNWVVEKNVAKRRAYSYTFSPETWTEHFKIVETLVKPRDESVRLNVDATGKSSKTESHLKNTVFAWSVDHWEGSVTYTDIKYLQISMDLPHGRHKNVVLADFIKSNKLNKGVDLTLTINGASVYGHLSTGVFPENTGTVHLINYGKILGTDADKDAFIVNDHIELSQLGSIKGAGGDGGNWVGSNDFRCVDHPTVAKIMPSNLHNYGRGSSFEREQPTKGGLVWASHDEWYHSACANISNAKRQNGDGALWGRRGTDAMLTDVYPLSRFHDSQNEGTNGGCAIIGNSNIVWISTQHLIEGDIK